MHTVLRQTEKEKAIFNMFHLKSVFINLLMSFSVFFKVLERIQVKQMITNNNETEIFEVMYTENRCSGLFADLTWDGMMRKKNF